MPGAQAQAKQLRGRARTFMLNLLCRNGQKLPVWIASAVENWHRLTWCWVQLASLFMQEYSSSKQTVIRILLVDDHPFMRDGMRLSLEQDPGLAVVGEAGDGAAALQLASELCPDVVIMDIDLPDGEGITFSCEIVQRCPKTRIVIYTALVGRKYLDLALAAGIRNYVLKGEAPGELHTAVRRAMQGEVHLSQEVMAMLIESYQAILVSGRANDLADLSERETTILRLMADGSNTKEIAGRIGCSVKTVDYYRKRLMSKMGVHSVAALIKYAIRQGLTAP